MVSGNFTIDKYKAGSPIDHWLEELENFMLAEYGQIDNVRKKAVLLTAIGKDNLVAINNFAAVEKDTYVHLLVKLKNYYAPQENETVERHAFYSMTQEEDETIEDFLNRLKEQALKCNFRVLCQPAHDNVEAVYHDQTNEFLRDRIVVGIHDDHIRRRLMRERNLTLDTAVDLIKATERADKHLEHIVSGNLPDNLSIDANRNRFRKTSKEPQINHPRTNRNTQHERLTCKYCGGKHQRGADFCPAFGQTCNACNKMNHFKKVCKAQKQNHTRTRRNVNSVEQNEYDTNADSMRDYTYTCDDVQLEFGLLTVEYDSTHCNTVELDVDSIVKDWFETVYINNIPVTVKIDTGAQANVVAKSTLNKLMPHAIIVKSRVILSAYGGSKLPVMGKVKVSCGAGNLKIDTDFIVVDTDVKTVLGLDSCIKLKFVKLNNINAVNQTHKLSPIRQTQTAECEKVVCTDPSENVPQTHMTVKSDVSERVSTKCGEKVVYANNSNFSNNTSNFREKRCDNKDQSKSNYTLQDIIYSYSDLFDNTTVGCLKDYEYSIKLKTGAVPKIHPPRQVPFSIQDKVTAELERMTRLGVLARVDEPTEWVNSMVIVERDNKMRICLDPSILNKSIMREHTHLPTQDEVLSQISGAVYFTKLDCKDGYWQIKLSHDSSMLTTFNTHIGRYRYTRLPFGLNSANEIFQKKVSQVYERLDGVTVMYDDILLYGKTIDEHNERLQKTLQRTREYGIKLNKNKCRFLLEQVEYIGHVISGKGVHVDPHKVSAINEMPKPQDKAGVQRLLGTLNFLNRFIPNLSTITHPMRQLLVKNVPFVWTYEHDLSFNTIKSILINSPVLGYYNVNDPIILQCDSSSTGLGACILQRDRPIAYASRSLTNTQTNYAQIEKELLAIVFGCERFKQYLYGKEIEVHTDHKPLINILSKSIHDNPVRIQRLILRLQCYNLTLKYVPGKDLHIPDMLSRAYVDSKHTDSELTDEADCMVHVVIKNFKCSDFMRNRIIDETERDPALCQVRDYIVNGWPEHRRLCSDNAKLYWQVHAELVSFEGLILFRDRIVIPKSLRTELLARVHEGHQGRERCKRLARTSIYWPGLNEDIDNLVDGCEPCLLRRDKLPREPLIPHQVPDRAWQKVGVDLFSYAGQSYQLVVDYFSKWVEVGKLGRNPTSSDCINHIKTIFSRFGIAENIMSDGDFLYTSRDFTKFCKFYESDHTFSSAGFSSSNGQVERGIKTIKNLVIKCAKDGSDLCLGLLQYRNTPLGPNLGSPAELLFNRKLRTKLPYLNLSTEYDAKNRVLLQNRQAVTKEYFDRTASKSRKPFDSKDFIKYRDSLADKTWKSGQILSARSPNNRSYSLVNENGNIINWNNRLLITDKTAKCLRSVIEPGDYVSRTGPQKPLPTQPQIPEPTVIDHAPNQLQPQPASLRRSTRVRHKPSFYGKPVAH